MTIRTLYCLILMSWLLQPPVALADSWKFDPVKKDRVEIYGDIKIIRTTDARKNHRYPDFILSIYSKNKLLAKYKNVGFQKLFASPDHSIFVGLSNRGLPGTAVIIFDNKGNLRLEVKHDLAEFDYCEKSMTLARQWYDDDKSEVQFIPDEKNGGYKMITVRDCKGNTKDLMQLILRAYNNSFQKVTANSDQ